MQSFDWTNSDIYLQIKYNKHDKVVWMDNTSKTLRAFTYDYTLGGESSESFTWIILKIKL